MSEDTKRPIWMEDELVRNIPKDKLDFLERMNLIGHGKSQKELIPTLMPMMKQAKQENLTFTPQEMASAIAAIKKYSSPEELKEIDKVLKKVPH